MACRLALESDEPWVEATARWHLALHTVRGPGEIEELLRRGHELIHGLGGAAEANYYADASSLHVARGDPDEARSSVERALSIGREFWPIDEFYGPWLRGCLLIDLDQPDEALPLLRTALEAARGLDVAEAGTILVDIARALLAGGDVREASAAIDQVQAVSEASGDLLERARWCGVRSRVLATSGQLDDALVLVENLMRLAVTSQAPDVTYSARMDAATVLAAAADYDGARRLYEQALRESEARGAHGFARRAAEGLARVDDFAAQSAAGSR